jgi:D-hydroxyproline dehydrogenase subunit alpha
MKPVQALPRRVPVTEAAQRLGSDAGAFLRRSVSGEPRAPVCGMGVCHECAVDVEGRRQLACQTLCRPPGEGVPPRRTAMLRDTADLLIIGAGPAGLAAAEAAAPSGARIVVVDDNPQPGGQIWRDGPAASLPQAAWRAREALAGRTHVSMRLGTRVVAPLDGRRLLLEDDQGAIELAYGRLVLATGARELLLPFPGWTLPGVTGAGGLQALVKGGLDVRHQRVVVGGSGPLLLAVADTLRRAGAQVVAVAEQAPRRRIAGFAAGLWRWPGKAWQALALRTPGWQADSLVLEALGSERLAAVRLRCRDGDVELPCDRLACGWGLVPNVGLAQLLGCTLDLQHGHPEVAVDALQHTSQPGIWAAGECCGIAGVESARVQGRLAGLSALADANAGANADAAGSVLRVPQSLRRSRADGQRYAEALRRAFTLTDPVRRLARPDTLVCRCEDVPRALLEDCDGWLDAKLQTRCGMGPCQGRVCGPATYELFGWQPASPRHLLVPARLDTLAAVDGDQPPSAAPG